MTLLPRQIGVVRVSGLSRDEEIAHGSGSSKAGKFNPGLSKILNKDFSSKNMQLEPTKYC